MNNHEIFEPAEGFRSGYCAILGRPNVGKSTLLNAIIGEKIAIVTDKPQTTRDRLAGIYTDETRQIVFVDTPGVIDPRDRFNEYLLREAREGIEEVDVVLHLLDAADRNNVEPIMAEVLKTVKAPVFLVANKIDAAPRNFDLDAAGLGAPGVGYARRFAVSALTGEGVKDLVAAIGEELPEGFPFYDPEQICDRDLRYLVAERVREKVFDLLRQEAPYAVATQVDEFRERPEQKKTYINVNIFVERDSQKGLVIGAGGQMIKRIGQEARAEIEDLLGGPVFLELGVKVRKKWRKHESALREFGYATAAGRKRKNGRDTR